MAFDGEGWCRHSDNVRDLGGSRQTGRLDGHLELFIADRHRDTREARIWITDIEEHVRGLDVYGLHVFPLAAAMLGYTGFGPCSQFPSSVTLTVTVVP
ncbi:hypothetical protein ACI797_09160 [Geodermatophilus sp. SYSU D00691]